MIDIGTLESTQLKRDDSSLKIALFKAFRIGGILWKRTRTSGGKGGVTGKANTVATTNNIAVYVARSKDVSTSTTSTGVEIPDDQYEFVAPGNPDIQAGDVIVDMVNTSLSFLIKTSTPEIFDRSGICEQRGKVV